MLTFWMLSSILSGSFLLGMGKGYQGNVEGKWRNCVVCVENPYLLLFGHEAIHNRQKRIFHSGAPSSCVMRQYGSQRQERRS